MQLRARPVVLGLCVAAGLASPAMAQQSPSCAAFAKDKNGDWITKQDMMLPAPKGGGQRKVPGPVQIKGGQRVDEKMQEELDEKCK
jgi:hypothetical protein